jgi:glyoxylase-like metal-dependent hydrolase (beta-lactamase superfamily II)
MLQMLTDRVGFVPGGTNIGVVRVTDHTVFLIDSGLNDTIARKVLRAVRENLGSEPVAIVNTHAHADHFGANAWLRKRIDLVTLAPSIEATIIENPILQPALLYGGADPLDALRSKFLLAEASPVEQRYDAQTSELFGLGVEPIPLRGHSPNQHGLVIDGVFFCADVVFPPAAIDKYPIPYLYGLTDHLASLDVARQVHSNHVVPGHGDRVDSIDNLIQINREAIDRAIEAILDAAKEPVTGDELCGRVFSSLNVPMVDAQAYFLLRPTMNAYFAHLERTGHLLLEIGAGCRALWRRP